VNKNDTIITFRPEIRFDNSDLNVQIYPNKRSRFELLIEGDRATVIEKGKALITGQIPKETEIRILIWAHLGKIRAYLENCQISGSYLQYLPSPPVGIPIDDKRDALVFPQGQSVLLERQGTGSPVNTFSISTKSILY
jgi:hypothetical protein